jgi:heme-degrading monooxygenase HmoA
MIRVIYRFTVDGLCEEAFVRSWRQCTDAICGTAKGAKGGLLLRSERNPREYVLVTRWESVEAWREFWSKGPPEPAGDPELNEILIEVDSTLEDAPINPAERSRGESSSMAASS